MELIFSIYEVEAVYEAERRPEEALLHPRSQAHGLEGESSV